MKVQQIKMEKIGNVVILSDDNGWTAGFKSERSARKFAEQGNYTIVQG